MAHYARPQHLEQALSILAEPGWVVLAGGTDHFPARVVHTPNEAILDVTALPELKGIDGVAGGGLRLGAGVTWAEVIEANLPSACDGLKAAAREVGGVQIQNRGTIGGNLCNASPAADGMPPLLSLDAEVELASVSGIRRLPLEQFVLGNRQTARRPDELLVAVYLPAPALEAAGRFLKLGARRYLVISIVMVAGTLSRAADGTIETARLAVGACSAAATRLPELEAALSGQPIANAVAALEPQHLEALSPIDDVRADASYRRHAALTLVRRCLSELTEAA